VGNIIALTASSTDTGSLVYVWKSPGNTFDTTQNLTITHAVLTDSGTWTVQVVNTNNMCGSAGDSVLVAVVLESWVPTASYNHPVCPGATLSLTATGQTGATYSWTGPNGFNQSGNTVSLPNADSAMSGTYTVVETIGGCQGPPTTLNVVISPVPLVTAGTTTPGICLGLTIDLTATPQGGTGPYTYSWSGPNGFTSSSQNPTIASSVATDAGNYNVTITDQNNCTAVSSAVGINIFPIPNDTIIIRGDSLIVPNYTVLQWYLNGTAIPGATGQVYITNVPGSYTVRFKDSNNCSNTTLAVQFATGVNNPSADQLLVYPNPLAEGYWQLEVPQAMLGNSVEIFDDNGRIVYKGEIREIHTEIGLNVASGVYLMRVFSGSSSVVKKLMKL
jgi:hypothetical protein